MELISVIIPVYNVENSVGRCIESVINQTFSNIEIVIVDDGSTDNSSKIISFYAEIDCRIVIVSKTNGGVSSARNTGLSNASGDYITFVDADDYVDENYLQMMYIELKKSRVQLAAVGWKDQNGELGYVNKYVQPGETKIFKRDEIPSIELLSVWGHLFVKEIIDNIKFDENIYYGEDLLFTTEYVFNNDCYEIAVIGDPLYTYVTNRPDSAINQAFNEKRFTVINAYLQILQNINSYEIITYNTKRIIKNVLFNMYCMLLVDYNKRYKTGLMKIREFLLELRKQGFFPQNRIKCIFEGFYLNFFFIVRFYLASKRLCKHLFKSLSRRFYKE